MVMILPKDNLGFRVYDFGVFGVIRRYGFTTKRQSTFWTQRLGKPSNLWHKVCRQLSAEVQNEVVSDCLKHPIFEPYFQTPSIPPSAPYISPPINPSRSLDCSTFI